MALVAASGCGSASWLWAAGSSDTVPPPKFTGDTIDVFFEDALKMLGPGQPGLVRVAVPAGAAATGTPGAPAAGGSATGGSGDKWSAIVSRDTLEAEVKAQVPKANEASKSSSYFKGDGHHLARNTYSYLAILFAVISKYDGEVRWKDQAVGLRHKFSQVAFNCKTSSDATFNESKSRAQDLGDLMNGQGIELPPNPDPDASFGKVSGRPPLMIRLEEGRTERLGAWTSDKGAFSKNKADLMREAEVFAMIAKTFQDPDFEFGDDPNYQKYAADLETQCQALISAVKTDNQEGAQSAIAQISKACDACHGDFR